MDKPGLVDLLNAMGATMRRRGDLSRAAAYYRAANEVQRRPDFEELVETTRLREIRGVGPSIERTIVAFVQSGERPAWVPDAPPRAAAPEIPEALRRAPFGAVPDLHVHTTWSDGTLTIEEVAAIAEEWGLSAIGISDHSGSLTIARGLAPDAVRAQWAEIDRVQARHPSVRLLKGTECDILRDGRLDHPAEILEGFDYVIGSLHSQLRLPTEQQTPRVLAALDEAHLTILGHPTTRVPNRRPRAHYELNRVFAKAAEVGVAMEVNGNPGRLDLDAPLAKEALEAGCRLSLASDAHSAGELLSVFVARETAAAAGATADDLVDPTRKDLAPVRGGERARA